MNLIRSAISTPKLLFLLPRCTIDIQQLSTSSLLAKHTSTLNSQQPKKPRNPKTSHSLTWSQTLNKQPLTSSPTWPRPGEIPYQPKLPNFVNLFGIIQLPAQIHVTKDGKHMVATFIAQIDGPFIANSSTSVLIPVVFEGDLAHTVASHVKPNDCVYVTGKLSLNPLPFVLTETQGNFYLLGNEINFVQGLDMQGSNPIQENVQNKNQDKGIKGAIIEGVERKVDGKGLDLDSSTPLWVYNKLDELNLENKIEPLNTEKKSVRNVGGTTKDANSVFNSWRDLVKNPTDWVDYREIKSSGSVKAKHPDFKHKANGTSLWLNTAPNWVLAGLAGLNVSGKGKKEDGSKEESWKDLFEDPDKWWDNRLSKTNAKAPDFRHKETSEGLWLNSCPEWVLSQLPCSKNEHNVASVNKNSHDT